jgi:hypothetical protein
MTLGLKMKIYSSTILELKESNHNHKEKAGCIKQSVFFWINCKYFINVEYKSVKDVVKHTFLNHFLSFSQ